MRGIAALVALGLAALLAGPGLVGLELRDLPDPGDADLAGVPAAPAPVPNAFDALRNAAAALPADPGELETTLREALEAEPFDAAAAEATVVAHERALAAFRGALDASGFHMPAVSLDEDLPDLRAWFAVARLHALDARVAFERGDADLAGEALLALLRLGQQIQRDPAATWVHWIAGAELKEITLRTWIGATAVWRPSAEESLAWSETLAGFASRPEDERAAWAGEYRTVKEAVLSETEFPAGSYSFHPNRTLALHAERTRALQARAGRPCSELRAEPEPPPRSRAELLVRGLRPNAVGEILAEVAQPSALGFTLRRCAADTLLGATQLAIALAAAESETGALPEALDALVPGYLRELPNGAFDLTAFRLDRDGRRLLANGSALPEATVLQQSPEYALPAPSGTEPASPETTGADQTAA